MDSTWWLYVIIGTVSLWGCALFLAGWRRADTVRPVYVYMILMFLGESIRSYINAYARYVHVPLSNPESWSHKHATIWSLRLYPLLVALLLIIGHMTLRYARETIWIQHKMNPVNLNVRWGWYNWLWRNIIKGDVI